MQELISALTAHEEECSREFEADLSAFCTRHMDAQLVQQLRQLVAEGEEDLPQTPVSTPPHGPSVRLSAPAWRSPSRSDSSPRILPRCV